MVYIQKAVIEGIYDVVYPERSTGTHRWGREVWLNDIKIGSRGQMFFVEDGVLKRTRLSTISNIIEQNGILEIYTQTSLYRLRLLFDLASYTLIN